MEEAAVAKNSLVHMSISGQWTHCLIYRPPSFLGAHIPTNTFFFPQTLFEGPLELDSEDTKRSRK